MFVFYSECVVVLPWVCHLKQVFVALSKFEWVKAEVRVVHAMSVYKRKTHYHVAWLCTGLDFLECSFQKDPSAYLLTPLDKGICQVDYVALWWYICFIASARSCFFNRHVIESYAYERRGECVDILDQHHRRIVNDASAACCCWFCF